MSTKFFFDPEKQAVLLKAFCNGTKYEQFELLVPNSTEAATEKHLPVAKVEGNIITVGVGEVEHPMAEDHFITFIALETKQGDQIVRLQPGDKPEAVFAIAPGDEAIAVYEFCNKHGLWKTEL